MLIYKKILSSDILYKKQTDLCRRDTDLFGRIILMVFLWGTTGDFLKHLIEVGIIRKSNDLSNFINL